MGFVIADRELFEHPIWLMEPFTKGQAWFDLIGLANHCDTQMIIRNKVISCKRGDVNRSLRYLSRRWQWSPNKVARFIDFLEEERMARRKTEQGETVLTLCNYDYWQGKYLRDKTQNETENETATRQQRDTNNNVNNYNKFLNKLSYPPKAEDNEQDYEAWKWEMDRIKSGSPL